MHIIKLKAIKHNPILLLLLAVLFFGSCKREMINEIISETPPELSVIVYQGVDKNARVPGATVELFASEADRTAEQNMISSVVTDTKGEALFKKESFTKGELFVKVTKDGSATLATTPYLLQNDGKTIVWIAQN